MAFDLSTNAALTIDAVFDDHPDFSLSRHQQDCCSCGGTHDYALLEAKALAGLNAWTAYQLSLTEDGANKPVFADDISDNTSTTATLSIGSNVSSAVDTAGDRDWFRVELVAGQRYTFTLNASGATPLGDPLLRLMNSAGTQLIENDDSGGSLNSTISFTATATGSYYLNAGAYSTGIGGYTLSAATAPPITTRTFDGVANFLTSEYWSPARWAPGSNISYNIEGLSAGAQALADRALTAWGEVTGLSFTRTTAAAQMTFQNTAAGAYASFSTGGTVSGYRDISSAIINVNAGWSGGTTEVDSYTYQTFLHEVGHAIGLGHAGPYNGSATYGLDNVYLNDSWAYSVMSYFDQQESGYGTYRLVLGPQVADLIAVQNLYGTDPAGTRTGNTVYGFGSTETDVNNWAQFVSSSTDMRPPSYAIYDTGGTDTINLSGYSAAQTLNLNPETFSSLGVRPVSGGIAFVNVVSIARGTIIENALGGSGNDVITGNTANNELHGLNGNDTLLGGDGDDALFGGAGADQIDGGNGRDTVTYASSSVAVVVSLAGGAGSGGDAAGDVLTGIEVLNGSAHNDVLSGSANGDTLSGDAGNDAIYGHGGNDVTDGGNGNDVISGGDGDDTVAGGNDNDTLYGNAGVDSLSGGAGIDILIGSFGIDTLTGGTSGDYLYGDEDNDFLYGEDGDDVLVAGSGNDRLESGAGFDYLYAGDGDDIMVALSGTNVFIGEAGNDQMVGGTGRDYFYGGIGNDIMIGGADIDILIGEDGADFLQGEAGQDYLYAGNGDDTLNGNDGVDFMLGEAGNDTLNGGRDVNYLYGGAGNDNFFHNTATGAGVDVISDFEFGFDRISLVSSTMNSLAAVQAGMTYSNDNGFTIITTGAGTAIWIAGDVRSTLSASDFTFITPAQEEPDAKTDAMEDLAVSDPEAGLLVSADWAWADGVTMILW